jgi:hypothetical protein
MYVEERIWETALVEYVGRRHRIRDIAVPIIELPRLLEVAGFGRFEDLTRKRLIGDNADTNIYLGLRPIRIAHGVSHPRIGDLHLSQQNSVHR